MIMSKPFKIEVVHDDSGEVVKRLGYNTENERDKAYSGLIRNMNLAEYTANCIDPDIAIPKTPDV